MDAKGEIREFLASRRARITPDQVGLPIYGDNRRRPGLHREEVALLAGVSVNYYTRLERGNAGGVSDGVLETLAGALRLDEAERQHLFDLAHALGPATRQQRKPAKRIRPGVQRILDAMTGAPAPEFEVRSHGPVEVGLDGEALVLDPPLWFTSLPGALRVRLPSGVGLPPAARAAALTRENLGALVRVAVGR